MIWSHGQKQEVAVLHVGDRPHAHHRRAAGDAEEAQLGDRRVDHPIGKPLFQPERHGEGPAPSARHARCPRRCRTPRGSRSISSAMASRSASAIPSRLLIVSPLVGSWQSTSVVRSCRTVGKRLVLSRSRRCLVKLRGRRGRSIASEPGIVDRSPRSFKHLGESFDAGLGQPTPRAPPLAGNGRGRGASGRSGGRSAVPRAPGPALPGTPRPRCWAAS